MTKVRFAPSPTGFIHLGNARAALINYMFSKQHNGVMILRIDDTDKERSTKQFEEGIYEDLKWLGINFDEKYKQSERNDLYEKVFKRLIDGGFLYPCYESKEELDDMRKSQMLAKKPPLYNRQSLNLTHDEKIALEATGVKPYWRFKLSRTKIELHDLIHNNVKFDLASVSDPVVRKADGDFTYFFASCVDDIDLCISHVIRGDDHLANTASQIELLKAIDPNCAIQFAHYPLINFEDSGKMSKRYGDISIKNFKSQGLEPETIFSFLSKIGTSEPVRPVFDTGMIISEFNINKISKSSPKIFVKDMFELNRKFLSSLTYKTAHDKFQIESEKLWTLIKDNLYSEHEISLWMKILTTGFTGEKVDENFTKTLYETLSECEPYDDWHELFIDKIKDKLSANLSMKEIFTNMRLLITGSRHGPHFSEILKFLGYDETLSRIIKLSKI